MFHSVSDLCQSVFTGILSQEIEVVTVEPGPPAGGLLSSVLHAVNISTTCYQEGTGS